MKTYCGRIWKKKLTLTECLQWSRHSAEPLNSQGTSSIDCWTDGLSDVVPGRNIWRQMMFIILSFCDINVITQLRWCLLSPVIPFATITQYLERQLKIIQISYTSSKFPSRFSIHWFLFFFWLRWVFIAAHGPSLVAASGGHSSLQYTGFLLQWPLLLRSMGSRHAGFSSCGSRALERRLSSCGAWA